MKTTPPGKTNTAEPGENPGYAVSAYSDERHAEVLEDLVTGDYGYKCRLVDGVVMPPYITPARYRLSRTLETRPGDVCYTSYPKSGSTWLAHVLVRLLNGGEVPADKTLRDCLHWIASSWTYPRSREELDALPSPRILKSHMPYQMAVGGTPSEAPCKYLYIARNPKDVAVSYYYFERGSDWSGRYDGPWEHWLELFLNGRVQRGDWFDHALSWWAHRDAPNVLFLKYEDLLLDFETELERLASFLDCELSPGVAARIAEKTSFDEMRQAGFSNMHEIPGMESFFRKGKIGSWREQFTAAESEAFDRIYAERMSGSGLDFNFGADAPSPG
jgi:hypothetical protein